MARISPSEALQRASSAVMHGMQLAAAKTKKAVFQPEFVAEMRADGIRGWSPDGKSMLYLYRQGNGGLVLPALDNATPILGVAEQADFTLEMPAHVRWWLQQYAAEMDWQERQPVLIEDAPEAQEDDDKPGAGEPRKTVPYMVKTKWSQGYPYNKYLDFGDGRCMVGCTAVMIAQIMYYWGTKGYRRGCTATSEYQWQGEKYKVKALPPITVFNYWYMTTGKPKTEEQIEAVATILEYVGKAIKSNYGIDATWADTGVFPPLMISRLRLGNTIKSVRAQNIGETAFEAAIYQELLAGRPVGFWGTGDTNGCHAFVCDGYNATTKKFHFNFGWGGSYDGDYAMSAINLTKTHNYNNRKGAIIGIQPEYKLGDANRDGEVNVTDAMVAINHGLKVTYDEAADVNSDGKVTVADHTPIVNHILGKEPL